MFFGKSKFVELKRTLHCFGLEEKTLYPYLFYTLLSILISLVNENPIDSHSECKIMLGTIVR